MVHVSELRALHPAPKDFGKAVLRQAFGPASTFDTNIDQIPDQISKNRLMQTGKFINNNSLENLTATDMENIQSEIPSVNAELAQHTVNARGAQLVATAQNNMRHGQLVLTGSSFSGRGQMFYHGYYAPAQPMNIASTTFRDFAPGQSRLVKEHLDFYKDEFNEGENAQIEPVELAPTEQGQIGVVDGHHRLAAGLSLGKPVPLSINLDTEPTEAMDWANVRELDLPNCSDLQS